LRVYVVHGDSTVGTDIVTDAQHEVRFGWHQQTALHVQTVGVDAVVLQHPGVDVDVAWRRIVDLDPLTVRVDNRIRVLHDFGDDYVAGVGRLRLDYALVVASVSGQQVTVIALFSGFDSEFVVAAVRTAFTAVSGAVAAIFSSHAGSISTKRLAESFVTAFSGGAVPAGNAAAVIAALLAAAVGNTTTLKVST